MCGEILVVATELASSQGFRSTEQDTWLGFEYEELFLEACVGTFQIEGNANAMDVTLTGDALHVSLADGRELSAPLAWFPRLRDATAAQRNSWRLIGRGVGIHWPELDEDVSIASLLRQV